MTEPDLQRRSFIEKSVLAAASVAVASLALPQSATGTTNTLTLMFIRHGEKPDGAWPGPGLTVEGAPADNSLVVRGWQRAGSWSALFGTGLGGPNFPIPNLIYAANPNPAASTDVSMRPFETITPLAARLGVTPVTKYAVGQEDALAAELSGLTGVVLVCWEHKAIAKAILPALTAGQGAVTFLSKWDGSRFDVVLRLDRPSADAPWTFKQLFPCLLSGDDAEVMK